MASHSFGKIAAGEPETRWICGAPDFQIGEERRCVRARSAATESGEKFHPVTKGMARTGSASRPVMRTMRLRIHHLAHSFRCGLQRRAPDRRAKVTAFRLAGLLWCVSHQFSAYDAEVRGTFGFVLRLDLRAGRGVATNASLLQNPRLVLSVPDREQFKWPVDVVLRPSRSARVP